jgi:hypothetical protein
MLTDVSTEEVPPKHWRPHAEVQSAIREFTAVRASTLKITLYDITLFAA